MKEENIFIKREEEIQKYSQCNREEDKRRNNKNKKHIRIYDFSAQHFVNFEKGTFTHRPTH